MCAVWDIVTGEKYYIVNKAYRKRKYTGRTKQKTLLEVSTDVR